MNQKQNGINILASLFWLAMGVFRIISTVDYWKACVETMRSRYANGFSKTVIVAETVLETAVAALLLGIAAMFAMAKIRQAGLMLISMGSMLVADFALHMIFILAQPGRYVSEIFQDWRSDMVMFAGILIYCAYISLGTKLMQYEETGNPAGWYNATIVYVVGFILLLIPVLSTEGLTFKYYSYILGNGTANTAVLIINACALFFGGFYIYMLSRKPYGGVRVPVQGVPAAGANGYAPFNRDLPNGMVNYPGKAQQGGCQQGGQEPNADAQRNGYGTPDGYQQGLYGRQSPEQGAYGQQDVPNQ